MLLVSWQEKLFFCSDCANDRLTIGIAMTLVGGAWYAHVEMMGHKNGQESQIIMEEGKARTNLEISRFKEKTILI